MASPAQAPFVESGSRITFQYGDTDIAPQKECRFHPGGRTYNPRTSTAWDKEHFCSAECEEFQRVYGN